MGDVLQGAAALCLCKLACTLVSLPSLSTTRSPVSLCCCCLLVFTDCLVTVFLSFLYVFQSWLPELTGDVIALRFLLFLSHVYGEVLLLIIPLIVVDTLYRLPGSAGRRREESDDSDADRRLFHICCYLCCLSVWVMVALNVRWRWKLEEVWSTTCLHATSSLITCLPRLFHPVPAVAHPCWGMVFLLLLLLLLRWNTGLQGRQQAPAQADTATHGGKGLAPVGSAFVDPGKTQSSCTLHREHFWNGVQMRTRHHGDPILTFLPDPQHMITHDGWGFTRHGASAMMGLVVVLSIFVLPLNLGVNILVIRTVDALLELGLTFLVSFTSHPIEIPAFHNIMIV